MSKLEKLVEDYRVVTCVVGALNLYDFRVFQTTFFSVRV
jgi:hypothetical protein